MAVRIILKNSSVEDKRPSVSQLENGEIALNYNEAGAFLTCKDTNGDIQQVGGVKINDVAPDAPPIQCLWFQPSSLTLFVYDGDSWLPVAGGGGGTPGGGDITQIIGNQGIDANEIAGIVTLDVELDGTNCGLKFNSSKLSAEIASDSKLGSVKIGDGINVDAAGTISVDLGDSLVYRGSVDLNEPPSGQITPDPAEKGDTYVVSLNADPIDNGWTGIGGDAAVAGDLVVYNGTEWEIINTGGSIDAFDDRYVRIEGPDSPDNQTITGTGGLKTEGLLESAGGVKVSGGSADGFAYFTDQTDNNFFAGDVYIGGTTARNTFDLWKSTLTEEQLEQLEAGTLVAPANVSLPGDGEFARQWYYDQQDEETQALLDSGELEYPIHLAASTFTDTFALGDNTRINLNSNGSSSFALDATIHDLTVGRGAGAINTNTAVGSSALGSNTTGASNTATGLNALFSNTTGNSNTATGRNALFNNTTGNRNTAIGFEAGRLKQDGTDASDFNNCSYIGNIARCSASDQVQLGNSATTTFAYGAVQDRSDARDKTDIRDTLLGLDFVNSLRPVDFRWDYRDDYFNKEEYQEDEVRTRKIENAAYTVDGDEPEFIEEEYTETVTKERLVPVTKDGSRSRDRFHHGLIAQEVKAAADAQGIDFAGYQDHSVNGGLDVLSIGYTEMIAPLIKAVQELSAENAELKKRLDDAGL